MCLKESGRNGGTDWRGRVKERNDCGFATSYSVRDFNEVFKELYDTGLQSSQEDERNQLESKWKQKRRIIIQP